MHKVFARLIFSAILPVLFIFPCGAAEIPAAKVAIMPFTIHASSDLSYLSDATADMLGSRIAAKAGVTVIDTATVKAAAKAVKGPVTVKVAENIGKALGVDCAIFGSITVLGESVSIDAKAIEISGGSSPVAFYRQADSVAGIIPATESIAAEICEKLFGTAPAEQKREPGAGVPQAALAPAAAAPGAVSSGVAFVHPAPAPPPAASTGTSPFIKAAGASVTGFWKSPDFGLKLCGIAVADLDGDRKNETVLISDSYLCVRRFEKNRFYKVAERDAESYEKFISVDAADTDRDGRAEIFVTCINNNTHKLRSFVLGLSGRKLVTIAEKQPWYFRAVGTDAVYGQKRGLSDIFFPGIWRLEKKGTDYVGKEMLDLPAGVTVFGFTRAKSIGGVENLFVVSDSNDRIRLYTESGRLVWKSDHSFGGSQTFLEKKVENREQSADRIYLSQRIFATDINGDGKTELVTVKNEDIAGRVFGRYRKYGNGEFVCLGWDGLGMSELWHTRKISGYISDFTLSDFDNDGKPELAGAVVRKGGSVISGPKSCVISYDLENAL